MGAPMALGGLPSARRSGPAGSDGDVDLLCQCLVLGIMRSDTGSQSGQNPSRIFARRQKDIGRPHDDSRGDVVRCPVGHHPSRAVPPPSHERADTELTSDDGVPFTPEVKAWVIEESVVVAEIGGDEVEPKHEVKLDRIARRRFHDRDRG
jgi:hypothetical protein